MSLLIKCCSDGCLGVNSIGSIVKGSDVVLLASGRRRLKYL